MAAAVGSDDKTQPAGVSRQPVTQIQKQLSEGTTTCVRLVQAFLGNIHRLSRLNAFLEVFEQEALERAALVDKKIKEGKAGRLRGMVIGLKDNICYKGHRLSAASKILEGFTSLYSATAVERLLAEDAIIIGRLNCDEFGMGSTNENSAFGPVLNALDTTKVSGGSSGGSAVAVQAGLCHAALGSDTGGSVRAPASCCGVVGLKPTYGRVSRHGLIAYASSFDQIGTLTTTVEDAALLLDVISGSDDYDSTVSHHSLHHKKEKTRRVAYIRQTLEHPALDSEIKLRIETILNELKKKGIPVTEVELPQLDYIVPAYYILTSAEASSNLARYDGVRFGHRSKEASDMDSLYKKSRTEGFGKEVKRRIMLGTFVLSAGYQDAYYTKAQKVRRLIKEATEKILAEHDCIIMPVTPGTAYSLG
ncbi:MAG TPA: Asp-tRNA(Asn)/Glu-tRNA(Gln) amidotransferase subunit GatA, partial [Chitinophagales bacterium]|nr:Asp-tRNA(Asn)/Glu-tRNA(Gln) amidotransferase subunit GatA [Chitinophagales bacterium]